MISSVTASVSENILPAFTWLPPPKTNESGEVFPSECQNMDDELGTGNELFEFFKFLY